MAEELDSGRVAYLEARVGELHQTVGDLRAAIADIDAHATPVGLLNNDDPEGSPHHYLLTVGALHRALGKAYTAEPCESERVRLRAELNRAASSRQAWAEEAMRLDDALNGLAGRCEELSANADAKIGEVPGADVAWAAWSKAAQWMRKARTQPEPASRPVCAVHPTQDAAPGPHHPVGSPEGHFQPAPQRDQQRTEPTPSCAVRPAPRVRPLLDVPGGTCTKCCNTPLCPDGHRYRPERPACCGGSGRIECAVHPDGGVE